MTYRRMKRIEVNNLTLLLRVFDMQHVVTVTIYRLFNYVRLLIYKWRVHNCYFVTELSQTQLYVTISSSFVTTLLRCRCQRQNGPRSDAYGGARSRDLHVYNSVFPARRYSRYVAICSSVSIGNRHPGKVVGTGADRAL
jgi:hypothetical protein